MSDFDSINRKLLKSCELCARIERDLASYRAITDLTKALESHHSITAIFAANKAMDKLNHLSPLLQMINASQREHSPLAELSRQHEFIKGDLTRIAWMRALSDSITAPHHALHERLRAQSSIFEALSKRAAAMDPSKLRIPQLSQAALAWNVASTALTSRMNDVGLLAKRETLSVRILEVPRIYARFVQDTTDRLLTSPDPRLASRLRASLNLAEYQFLWIADALSGFIVVPEDSDEPDEVRILDAPYRQQDELILYERAEDESKDEDDLEALSIGSPTAQIVSRARQVLLLITLCNEAAKTSESGDEIFKPTTRLLSVFIDLPWLSRTDRSGFSEVLDCLYFMFYESAGKDKLRFLDKHGGPLTEADCELIWCIKTLRNKWTRHDADHGKEQDIRRSWAELEARLRWLGLDRYPTDPQHFQRLHFQLLTRAEKFLRLILSKLTLRN